MLCYGSQPGLDGQGLRAPAQARIHQQLEHKRPQHLGDQVLAPPEDHAGLALDRFEAVQVGLLQRLLGWVLEVAAIPPCPGRGRGRGRGDEQLLAVQ